MGWFKNIIGGKKNSFIGDTDSPEFAVYILKQLKDRHTTAIVNFKDDQHQYVTMVVDVDEDNKQLILDEISPQDGQDKVEKGMPFRVSSSDKGIATIFRTENILTKEDKGYKLNIVKLPEKVEYRQRRDAFRLKLTSDYNFFLNFMQKKTFKYKK